MIHFLCASPRPVLEGSDALYNEISSLRDQYGGVISHIYPFKTPSSKYPSILYGMHNAPSLIKRASDAKINHVFASTLFYLPVINFIKKPIIYNVVGSLNKNAKLPPQKFLKRISKIVVSNARDKNSLTKRGITNVHKIQTGIKFNNDLLNNSLQLNEKDKLTLLMASSPWELSQFESKGIHILLKAAKQMKNLRLIFVWRGLHYEYMSNLIKKYKVEKTVQLINEKVDIKKYINVSDGVILLSDSPTIVKSFPHSLLEGILSAKPIIVSKKIPISDYVRDYACGLVINSHNLTELLNKLDLFYNFYAKLKSNCSQLNLHRFKMDNMINAYGELYTKVQLSSTHIPIITK